MTLQPGETVEATVTATEVYGLFLQHGDDRILVLIPELEWVATISDCREFASVGDVLSVSLLAQADDGSYFGSIKQCHPEADPWRDPQLCVGSSWSGVVELVYEQRGSLVRLSNGLKGLLP